MSLQIASPPDSTYQLPQRWLLSWCYPSLISRIHIGLLLRLAGVAVIVHVGGGVVHGGGVVARGVLGQVLAPHVGQHLRAREFSFAIWHVHVRSRFVRMIVQIVLWVVQVNCCCGRSSFFFSFGSVSSIRYETHDVSQCWGIFSQNTIKAIWRMRSDQKGEKVEEKKFPSFSFHTTWCIHR